MNAGNERAHLVNLAEGFKDRAHTLRGIGMPNAANEVDGCGDSLIRLASELYPPPAPEPLTLEQVNARLDAAFKSIHRIDEALAKLGRGQP